MASMPSLNDLKKLRVVDLKERLSKLGKSTSGLKADLIDRLHNVLLDQAAVEDEYVDQQQQQMPVDKTPVVEVLIDTSQFQVMGQGHEQYTQVEGGLQQFATAAAIGAMGLDQQQHFAVQHHEDFPPPVDLSMQQHHHRHHQQGPQQQLVCPIQQPMMFVEMPPMHQLEQQQQIQQQIHLSQEQQQQHHHQQMSSPQSHLIQQQQHSPAMVINTGHGQHSPMVVSTSPMSHHAPIYVSSPVPEQHSQQIILQSSPPAAHHSPMYVQSPDSHQYQQHGQPQMVILSPVLQHTDQQSIYVPEHHLAQQQPQQHVQMHFGHSPPDHVQQQIMSVQHLQHEHFQQQQPIMEPASHHHQSQPTMMESPHHHQQHHVVSDHSPITSPHARVSSPVVQPGPTMFAYQQMDIGIQQQRQPDILREQEHIQDRRVIVHDMGIQGDSGSSDSNEEIAESPGASNPSTDDVDQPAWKEQHEPVTDQWQSMGVQPEEDQMNEPPSDDEQINMPSAGEHQMNTPSSLDNQANDFVDRPRQDDDLVNASLNQDIINNDNVETYVPIETMTSHVAPEPDVVSDEPAPDYHESSKELPSSNSSSSSSSSSSESIAGSSSPPPASEEKEISSVSVIIEPSMVITDRDTAEAETISAPVSDIRQANAGGNKMLEEIQLKESVDMIVEQPTVIQSVNTTVIADVVQVGPKIIEEKKVVESEIVVSKGDIVTTTIPLVIKPQEPKLSKNQRRKLKRKQRAQNRRFEEENVVRLDLDVPMDEETGEAIEDVEIQYIQDSLNLNPSDPMYNHFMKIFEAFKLTDPETAKREAEEAAARAKLEAKKEPDLRKKPKDADEEPEEEIKTDEVPKLSKRKLKKLNQLSISELKQHVARPDVVEMHDVTAKDPKLLVLLKSARNTVSVPRHWCFKRKYLQGKRGIEKPPFMLPDFIRKTGIMEMRQALQEKEDQKTMKAKMRERVRPKLGKIDIDYQKLHDAFFKWQTKPRMTIHGDLYYEGKEMETRMKEKKPGDLTMDLRTALGMPTGPNAHKIPPPWLIAMQRYGPPPSYPNLKVPGLNCPIPDNCSFGYHAGGWGKPPVDEMGKPLYGDVFGALGGLSQQPMMEEEIDRTLWGHFESESESEEEEEEEEEEEDAEGDGEGGDIDEVDKSGLVTPSDGGITPSGLTSIPAGMETPDAIELRKRKIESEMEGGETPALYTILPEKRAERLGAAMMASTHVYDMSAAMPGRVRPAGTGVTMDGGGVDVALDPSELDMDSAAMAARYEQTLREQQNQLEKEDLSDMVAEHSAKQKNKRKRAAGQQDTGRATKKYKDFKF